jgi:hypothetical protein
MAKRKKAGRPPIEGGREKFTTTLPPGYLDKLRSIGSGNASAGIIWLVDEHEKDAPAVRLRR